MTLRSTWRGPRRYVLVGALCALMHNAIMAAGNAAGIYYMILLVVSFLIITPIAYLLHSPYTFESGYSWRQLFRFSGGLALAFPISFVIMFCLCTLMAMPVPLATALATIALFIWNYASARWAILLR